MNCVTCHVVLTLDQEKRKVPYCSGNCRVKFYHARNAKKEIFKALTENSFERIGHYKISTLEKLGFVLVIKEKEISTL